MSSSFFLAASSLLLQLCKFMMITIIRIINNKNCLFFRIDNAENEKELRELKKVLDDIKGRMKKLDQESIDKFSDIIKVCEVIF